MSEVLNFAPGSAAATLLVPLWCRARCAAEYPALGVGAADALLLKGVRADFSAARQADCTLYALRETLMLAAAWRYLGEHPGAALIDLGCGLDTVLRRAGGELTRRYYVDLPEVIALREKLLPPLPGETYIPADLRAGGWEGRIDAPDGAFFLMGGLLGHFERDEALHLLAALAERFPGGGAAFDGVSALSLALGGRSAGLKSALPNPAALGRTGCFAQLRRVRALPEVFSSLPAGHRLKLGLLMGTGALDFFEARFAR